MVTNNEYVEFSERLNAALDEIGFPPKGKNRQKRLGEWFDVGQKGARKWLEAESKPKQSRHSLFIQKFKDNGLAITGEWLFYGNPSYEPDWFQYRKQPASTNQSTPGTHTYESYHDLGNDGKIKEKSEISGHKHSNNVNEPNIDIKQALPIRRKIPLINLVQAGFWSEIMDRYEPEEWIDTTANVTDMAFALRVVGDSMTNPYGPPSIPDGYIVIVEPEVAYKNGSIVVAQLENSKEAVLKKLVIDGPNRYLIALNPAYRAIEINEDCVICGVVQRVQYDL